MTDAPENIDLVYLRRLDEKLDGLVEVRLGSGVYVTARLPRGGQAGEMDVGPFELLEARHARREYPVGTS